METAVADSNNNNNNDAPESPLAPPTPSSETLKTPPASVTHPRNYYDRRYSALQYYKQIQEDEKEEEEEEEEAGRRSPPPPPLRRESPLDDKSVITVCQFCGENCESVEDLHLHLETHLGKKPYKCETCGKRFRGRTNLQFHMKASHNKVEASTSANHEGGEEELEEEEEEEEERLNGGRTEECASSSHSGSESFEKGVGVLVQDDASLSVEFPTLYPGLKSKISVKNEVVVVTRLDGVNTGTGSKESAFKCHLCDKIYSSMSRLQLHLSVHYEPQSPQLQCSFCDGRFESRLKLMQHLRTCHDAALSPSDDEDLPKSVSSSASSREGDKAELYACQFCNRSFDRLYSLHRHERVHTGFKPCFCSYCGKGFSESRNLRHHMIRYHSDGSEAHLLRRRSRHSSENSQRLKLVTADMIKDEGKGGEEMEEEEREELEPGELPKKVPRMEISEIREQERLDEDVTVVIPSDAPIDGKEPHAPRSNASDNPSTPSEGNEHSEEIGSAPVKSILGWKPKRRAQRSTPEAETTVTSSHMTHEQAKALLPSALGLPFSPLNISTLTMAGLIPSPIISPLYGNLTSPPLLTNPLSLYAHFPGIPSVKTDSQSSTTQSPSSLATPTSSSTSTTSPDPSDEAWRNRSSTSSDNAKGVSSLSRSHSSRLYVVRQPIKREDACKPTMLPNGRMVYRCTYCHKEFCTVSDVNRHMDFHEDIRPYKCKFCDYYARTNSQLKVHMMRHQGIREFHCRLCSYKGVTQSDLNRHMKSQIHMMKARNECKHCGEGFVSPMNLEKHYHEKHFSQYEHLSGSSTSVPIASVREVPPRKPRHECKLCGEGFMSPLELEKHYHDKHYTQYRQFLSQPAASVPH